MAVKSRKPKLTRDNPISRNNSSFSASFSSFSSSFSSFSSSSPFFPSIRVVVPVALLGLGVILSFYAGSYMFQKTLQGKIIPYSPSDPFYTNNNKNIKGKKVLVVVGEERELNEKIVMGLIERGAKVVVVRGKEREEEEWRREWEGKVVREVIGDLETVGGQKGVVEDIHEPENLDTIIFAHFPTHQPSSREDNGEGIEKTLAYAYFSRRFLLEGLVEKGFKGRVGSLGWEGGNKSIKDLNGDFMYEKGDQMANWVEANNALVLSFRKKKVRIYGINAPFQSILSILAGERGKGKAFISMISPYFMPTIDDFVEKLIFVMFSEYIPRTHIFLNQFGEGLEVSPYLIENYDVIWQQAGELVEKKEKKEDESWKKW